MGAKGRVLVRRVWVLPVTGAVVLTCVFVVFRSHPRRLLDPFDPAARQLLCGPRSVLIAIWRLGIPLDPADLIGEARVTEAGVSLRELERLASRIDGLRAIRGTFTPEDLKALDGTAVLFAGQNHFVAADPREAPPDAHADQQPVRVYEPGQGSRWYSIRELRTIWGGDAVALTRKKDEGNPGAPTVRWKTCLLDAGLVRNDKGARFTFEFENVGRRTLRVWGVRPGCACSSYEVGKDEVLPGETGFVEGQCDLKGIRGFFSSTLRVETNDPDCPISTLVMQGRAYGSAVLSTDKLYMGEIAQGESRSWEIFAHDPGIGELGVLDASFELSDHEGLQGHVKCSIEFEKVMGGSELVGRRGLYPVREGDYAIRLGIAIGERCPVGNIEGRIIVRTNLADPDLSCLELPVVGRVLPHVRAVPGAVLLTTGEGSPGEATIKLESLTGREFRVARFWVDEGSAIVLEPLAEESSTSQYRVSLLDEKIKDSDSLVERSAHFQLAGGEQLSVPLLIYNIFRNGRGE